jgi:hypothetical protein
MVIFSLVENTTTETAGRGAEVGVEAEVRTIATDSMQHNLARDCLIFFILAWYFWWSREFLFSFHITVKHMSLSFVSERTINPTISAHQFVMYVYIFAAFLR